MLQSSSDSPKPLIKTPRMKQTENGEGRPPNAQRFQLGDFADDLTLVSIYEVMSVNIFRFVFNNVLIA